MPIAPPYQARTLFSLSSMNCIAHSFGAPVTVTAQVWVRKASSASKPSRSMPSTWSTVWISREYISIWRRPITRTDPGSQTRDLSLRSTSVHMVSSDSSFCELSSARICRASAMASPPRAMVPEIGQVSTRSPLDAHEHLGRGADQVLALAEVDEEAVGRRVELAQPAEHVARQAAGTARKKVWPGTTSNRSPRGTTPSPCRTMRSYSPGSWSHSRVDLRGRRERLARAAARQAHRGAAVDLEVVADQLRRSRACGRRRGARRAGRARGRAGSAGRAQVRLDRVELEGEVVAERAVEAEVRVVRCCRTTPTSARSTENTVGRRVRCSSVKRAARAARCARAAAPSLATHVHDVRCAAQRALEGRQQHLAARVQRLDPELALARRERERRIDEADVPARVAAGILVARGEQHAAARVEVGGELLDGAVGVHVFDDAAHAHATPRLVGLWKGNCHGARG